MVGARALKYLGNTTRGILPRLFRQAATACVFPIAHFWAETWWPVHLATARLILPVYRTTPSIPLLRKSGILPAEVALNNISQRAARGEASLSLPTLSRFSKTCRRIPASEYFDPLANPPWIIEEAKKGSLIRINGALGPINTSVSRFRNFLSTLPGRDIQIYSDGLKLSDGSSGGGYVIFQFGIRVCSEAFPLGKFKDPYDAEAHAALKGIRAAIKLPSARFANNAWIFIDNIERQPRVGNRENDYLIPRKAQINIRWVSGHAGIEGNQQADCEEKKEQLCPTNTHPTRNNRWSTHIPNSYAQLEIMTAPHLPKELLLGRKALGQIIGARTGHGDFAAYHKRFKHEEARLNCLCGSQKTPTHFLFFRIFRLRNGRPAGPINQLRISLLGTPKGAKILTKWQA
ncbi:reverse transcriptase [Blumeria hordei DH14]|uniref:Reverse transcriptase n=1 Tax=Blumeria graminis f. sp. hordei (strain DH14) TaxID=546991 RepID=N1JAE9_BLUG1|nr:reverse transcriptase [Blumeria hordei DH14]